MEPEEVKRLDQVDLTTLTLEDIKKMKNPVLREAIMDALLRVRPSLASGHQNHGSHGSHTTESATFVKQEFASQVSPFTDPSQTGQ